MKCEACGTEERVYYDGLCVKCFNEEQIFASKLLEKNPRRLSIYSLKAYIRQKFLEKKKEVIGRQSKEEIEAEDVIGVPV